MKNKYPLVAITLDDHASFTKLKTARACFCTAAGFLVKEDKYAYYVAHWISETVEDPQTEIHRVVKHPGIKIWRA